MQTLDEYYPRVSLTALVKLLRTSHEVKYAVKATPHLRALRRELAEKYLEYVLYGYMDAIRRQDLDTEEDDHNRALPLLRTWWSCRGAAFAATSNS